jgi:predicted nucleotide-binding protein
MFICQIKPRREPNWPGGSTSVTSRDEQEAVPRDNCIFELGLFMGALGRERSLIVKPRGADIKMPSDLLGIMPLEYAAGTPDTLTSRLGPVCHDIRKLVASLGTK